MLVELANLQNHIVQGGVEDCFYLVGIHEFEFREGFKFKIFKISAGHGLI